MKATEIKWDVDNKEDLENLPKEIEIPDYIDKDDYDEIDDYLSNVTGFCHNGYVLKYSEELNMISKLCYELYKVDWKHSHMITKDREMDSIKNYYEGLVDDETEYSYNDYLEEFGYDGELYVCYEEFLNAEYLDENYMKELLCNEKLFKMYLEDLETNFYTE